MTADYPILSGDIEEAKDERSPGVLLLASDADSKTTAEDCGVWWYIREWEIYRRANITYWFARSGYSIPKAHIKAMARIP